MERYSVAILFLPFDFPVGFMRVQGLFGVEFPLNLRP